MHVDRPIEGVELGAAQRLHEVVVGEHATRGAREHGEELELELRERQRAVSEAGVAGTKVQQQRTDAELLALGGHRLRAPQHRTDAREQLARVEGLAEIVIGAELEPDDAVDVVSPRGEHEDRRPLHGRLRAHLLAQLEAVLARQHEVEQERIERLRLQRADQLVTVREVHHVDLVVAEVLADELGEADVVLDEQRAQPRH